MVTTKHALVLLLVFIAVSARHRNHEHTSDITSDTQTQEHAPELDAKRHRRKRWYNSYGYQAPSIRDEGMHGPPPAPIGPPPYDPFAYIYRRLDELTAVFRQPISAPTPVLVPYPVYINPVTCSCQPTQPGQTGQPGQQSTEIPQQLLEPMPNITIPNRFNVNDDDYDDIPIRPLSFDPVKPNRPLSRPVPPVEHGPMQGRAPVPTGREPSSFIAGDFQTSTPATTPTPSRCDVATLTCCHQRYATNVCFNSFGCDSALRSSNPCDARTIANVVSIFQNFYRNN